jgi:hypothetical protein
LIKYINKLLNMFLKIIEMIWKKLKNWIFYLNLGIICALDWNNVKMRKYYHKVENISSNVMILLICKNYVNMIILKSQHNVRLQKLIFKYFIKICKIIKILRLIFLVRILQINQLFPGYYKKWRNLANFL